MNNRICYLISLVYNGSLIKCAIKFDRDKLTGDAEEYPMEDENRKQFEALLPSHVLNNAVVVEITCIYEVIEIKEENDG